MQGVSKTTANLNALAELPSLEHLLSTLCKCRYEGNLACAMEMQTHICSCGLDLHENVGNHVIPMFVDCGSLPTALKSFMRLPLKNVYSWTALMQGLAQSGKWKSIIELYKHMKIERVSSSSFTIVALLKACAGLRDTETAQGFHIELAKTGQECVYVGTALVDMYAKCGLLNAARNTFQKMPARNAVTWNCLLAGYADYGTSAEAFQFLEQMRLDGVHPDIVTFVSILKVCANTGTIKIGQEIYLDLTKRGIETNSYAENVLVDMYAKHGFSLEAQNVFDRFPDRNFVSWTSLIAGYVQNAQSENALNCLERRQFENVFLDAAMFACILKICGNTGSVEKGLNFHMDLYKKGVESSVYVGSTLVDMYSKCGRLVEARNVLNKLPKRNVVSWNAMINGCGINDKSNSAVEVFENMQKDGVAPDATTFLCLLAACSRASLVQKGQEFFQMMRENNKILPNFGHLMCIVDLFARAGLLQEAGKFLHSLPRHPSGDMWTSFMSACKTYAEEKAGMLFLKAAYEVDNEKKQLRTLSVPALVALV